MNFLDVLKEVLDAIRVEFSIDEKGKTKISIRKGEKRDGKTDLGGDPVGKRDYPGGDGLG